MLIPVEQLIQHYGVEIKGVLHLGAHQAEEAAAYQQAKAGKVIWIEGNPELMPVLETELKKYPNHHVYNVLVSDRDDQRVDFNVTNNFQSSSMLELGSHKQHHPDVTVHHTLSLKTQRLDTFFEKNKIDISGCNFLNIDLQGAELLALKGLGPKLEGIQYIYTEINVGSVYVGCASLVELDRFLHEKGFSRVATKLTKWQWGDALYIKNNPTQIKKTGNIVSALYYQLVYFIRASAAKAFTGTRQLPGKMKRRWIPLHKDNVNPDDNGERNLLSVILSNTPGKIIIFDVGANTGTYTRMVLDELKRLHRTEYEIHLFEPQAACYQDLCRAFSVDSRIKINNFALSDREGQASLHYDYSGSSSASLFERQAVSLSQKETIIIKTLAAYLRETPVKKIDLLKIDTEGNEKKVLLGGGDFLDPAFVSAIQFEYGGTYLDAGITLAEVIQLLMNKGYAVGKIKENGIEYKQDLGLFTEDYSYSNYAATHKKIN